MNISTDTTEDLLEAKDFILSNANLQIDATPSNNDADEDGDDSDDGWGLDSVDVIDIVLGVEQKFGVAIRAERVLRCGLSGTHFVVDLHGSPADGPTFTPIGTPNLLQQPAAAGHAHRGLREIAAIVRGADGQIRAFHNVCRHRGQRRHAGSQRTGCNRRQGIVFHDPGPAAAIE